MNSIKQLRFFKLGVVKAIIDANIDTDENSLNEESQQEENGEQLQNNS